MTATMPLLSESADVLPIHRKILAFSFIGWIFDFYDLLLLSFIVASTTLVKALAMSRDDVPALLVVFIRTHMPEADVWLLDKKMNPARIGRGYIAVLSEMLGPALRKTTALATAVTTLNMAAYWFKTIWLPTYFHEIRGLSLGDSAWLLVMDQIGSVIGYVCFGFASDFF